MSSDWLRVALSLSEISRSILLIWRGMQNKWACITNVYSQSSCPQSLSDLFLRLKMNSLWFCQLNKRKEKKKITYKWAEYGVSKQEISDICNNKEKITKFANDLETSNEVNNLELSGGLNWKSLKVAHDEQLDKVLFHDLTLLSWFNQFCSLLLFIFSIIQTLDYSDYFV